MEYGMGIHGEPGIQRTKMQPADVLTEELYRKLAEEAKLKRGDEAVVVMNGLGATTNLELAIA